jgi:dipeptide transport system substrate-binding protein
MIRTRLAAILALACLAQPAAEAKTLVYCSEGAPEIFNPQLTSSGTTVDANMQIYQTLVQYKIGTLDIVPELAQSWEISPDGLSYVFHLRPGVKFQSNRLFQPSRDFDADDVIFSFERQWKNDNPYHAVSTGNYQQFGDLGLPSLLKSIDRLDDLTVRFVLTKPWAPFLADLTIYFAIIQSKEYADHLLAIGQPDQIDRQPIGTGPFAFVDYRKDEAIRYKRFAAYWGGPAKLDGLVFSITPDSVTRLAKLRSGECQIAPYPPVADLPAIRADKDLTVLEQTGLNIGYIVFNEDKKPFDDKRVRQALTLAIDRKAILDAVFQGTAVAAQNLLPPVFGAAWNDGIPASAYDPVAAKRLLAEAGYPDGFETDLWALPIQRPYNPDPRRMAELIQADLARIGVKANVTSYEWGEYLKRVRAGDSSIAEIGWTGAADPDDFFRALFGCDGAKPENGNAAKWCDPKFQSLIDRAAETIDPAARGALYREAEAVMRDDAPAFLVAHAIQYLPMRRNVTGYVMNYGTHRFDDTGLD